MKKMFSLAFMIMLVFMLAACGNNNNEDESDTKSNPNDEQESTSESDNENSQDAATKDDNSDDSEERIKLTFNGGEVIVKMYDNPTSRDFLEQLPLKLTFKDFSGFEKLSYPPEKLTTEGASSGYEPSRGDFAYFSPWGDVTMFYDDHSFSDGLVKLGEIESGVESLDNMNDDFEVSIEKMD